VRYASRFFDAIFRLTLAISPLIRFCHYLLAMLILRHA